jgi:hypothetical protein
MDCPFPAPWGALSLGRKVLQFNTFILLTGFQKVQKGISIFSETNVMHFSINLLRIQGLYMFRAFCSSSKGATQTSLSICYVSWLHPGAAN